MRSFYVAAVLLVVSVTTAFVAAAGNAGADRLAMTSGLFGLVAFSLVAYGLWVARAEAKA